MLVCSRQARFESRRTLETQQDFQGITFGESKLPLSDESICLDNLVGL